MKSLPASSQMKLGALGLVGLAALLFVPVPLVLNSAQTKALLDLVHLPLFAGITLSFHALWRGWFGLGEERAYLLTAVAAVLFAAGSEWMQGFLGRDASWGDVLNNLSATAITLTGLRIWKARHGKERARRGWWIAFGGALVLGTGLAAVSPIEVAKAVSEQRVRLPVLGDFEEDWELRLWRAQGENEGRATTLRRVEAHATTGRYSLRITGNATPWSGVHLLAGGADWSLFSVLRFTVHNPGDPFPLGLRLDAGNGLRFVGEVSIREGTNACVLPLSRLKNEASLLHDDSLRAVGRLVFHTGEAPADRTYFLDDVRLE